MTAKPRWKADVFYRYDDGLKKMTFYFVEMSDLHEIIEVGPHWDTVDHIELVRVNPTIENLTVEQAERL